MILDEIIESKKIEVALHKRRTSVSELESAIKSLPVVRNFREALGSVPCAIIAEVKRFSPSKGLLHNNFQYRNIAIQYEKNGAAAISVLTDEKYFGGHCDHLLEIRQAVNLPLLRKDFIIDPYQIIEARAMGADALLLITRILGGELLGDYIDLSEGLGLVPLVEVHTRKELDVALGCGAGIIGINNRNLGTFSTSFEASLALAPLVPPGTFVISESGISSREDIETLMNYGIHIFLVGEALMRSEDAGKKLRELLGK
jgi:indole-3-glycerol phosphate synthase